MMRAAIAGLVLALASGQAPSYRAEVEKYRADRLAELTAPNGWLAVQGLFWLHEGTNTAGSDPALEIKLPARAPRKLGVFTLAGGKVTFAPDPAAHVEVAGAHAAAPVELAAGERNAVVSARLSLFLLRRGDRVGLRLLDPDSHARRTFPGLRYFPLDPAYRIKARYTAYPEITVWSAPTRGQALRIALIAHGGTNAVVLTHLLGIPPVPWEWLRFETALAAVSIVGLRAISDNGYVWSLQSFGWREDLA